jgi:hypothetical protein
VELYHHSTIRIHGEDIELSTGTYLRLPYWMYRNYLTFLKGMWGHSACLSPCAISLETLQLLIREYDNIKEGMILYLYAIVLYNAEFGSFSDKSLKNTSYINDFLRKM